MRWVFEQKILEKLLEWHKSEIRPIHDFCGHLHPHPPVGLSTGIPELDHFIRFRETELTVIAARHEQGRIDFYLGIINDLAIRQRKSIAVYTLNKSPEYLLSRLAELKTAQVYVNGRSDIHMMELRREIRRLKMEKGLDMVIIDDFQLLSGGKFHVLKAIAIELNIPIIVMSQLGLEAEQSLGKGLGLSQLLEITEIESIVDTVICLKWDDFYEHPEAPASTADIMVVKNRNGPIGAMEARYLKENRKSPCYYVSQEKKDFV